MKFVKIGDGVLEREGVEHFVESIEIFIPRVNLVSKP